jgi:hypothetical protein
MENNDFIYTGFFDVKLSFSLKGLAVCPIGKKFIEFKKTGEKYQVFYPNNGIHNIILANIYIWP